MNVQIVENGRVAVTKTFRAEIPLMSAQCHWQDGENLKDLDEDFVNHLVLCSPACNPLASICKDASQQEVEQFMEEILFG